jgi:AbrB family looped-hinge helix DNA binding protein
MLRQIEMTTKRAGKCCVPSVTENGYRVESVVGIDERGQMVLPKDVRSKMGIEADDKLAIALSYKEGKVCCIHIFKADKLEDRVKEVAGQMPGAASR